MPELLKKIDQFFVLSDSSVNVYGFRLLTSGYQKDEFCKNPIGYYGHETDNGVLIKWEDVHLDGDQVLGKPVINMTHPRAERTVIEVENGFLNAASMGKIVLLEYELQENTEDPENPTIVGTKWYNKEASLVDSPGNRSAFKTELLDADDKEINLSDLTDTLKMRNMTKITLDITPELISVLGLDDKATAADIAKRIKDLKDDNTQLTADKTELQGKLDTATESATSKEVADILNKGLSDKKLTVQLKDTLATQYKGKPKELKDLVDALPAHVGVTAKIEESNTERLTAVELLKKSDWDTLDKDGKLQDLKDADYDCWAEKFKAKYKRAPKK